MSKTYKCLGVPWNKPKEEFAVLCTEEELAKAVIRFGYWGERHRAKELKIGQYTVETETRIDGEFAGKSSYTEKVKCNLGWWAETVPGPTAKSKKYHAKYKHIHAYVRNGTSVPKSWRGPFKPYLTFNTGYGNTGREMTVMANYFGDRLPKRFYDLFEGVLFKKA